MGKSGTLVLTAVVLVVVLVLVGCAKTLPSQTPAPAPVPAPPKTLDIGVTTPLTGPTAFSGTHIQDAVLLAIGDQNEEGGVDIAGQKYVLNAIIRDTKMDLIVAKSVAEELVFDKKVKVIAGPIVFDAIGAQTVTEANKVIMFAVVAVTPQMTGPNKPYTFFFAWPIEQMYTTVFAYVQKFYPQATRIVSMLPDLPDAQVWIDAGKVLSPQYGLDVVGVEKFPYDTKDFMPVISRVLAKNPNVINTGAAGGSMSGPCSLLMKQLREAGFNGIILLPANTDKDVVEGAVPKQYLNRIVINRMDPDSPVASEAYRAFCDRFQKKYNMVPNSMAALLYNPLKALFEFLNGQDSMDSTAWMEGFAKYHWDGLFGFENYWVGKPTSGINRLLLGSSWVGEWTDGKLEIKWEAPLPHELLVEQ